MSSINYLRAAITMGLSLVLTGCSGDVADYSKVELVSVGGTITLDGNPVEGAVITFESTETGSFSGAMSDSKGRYQLRFDSQKMGVTPGRKRIQIGTARKILGISSTEEAGESSEEEQGDPAETGLIVDNSEKIPACYNHDSNLFVDVTSSSYTVDFDLKSDCSTTEAK